MLSRNSSFVHQREIGQAGQANHLSRLTEATWADARINLLSHNFSFDYFARDSTGQIFDLLVRSHEGCGV